MRSLLVATALLSLPTMFGCSLDSVSSDEPDDEQQQDRLQGTYELTSTYDLTSSEALPGVISDVLEPLANLGDDPAGTIIGILEATDESVADLLALIPSSLRDQLEQKINDYVGEQIAGGGAVGDIIGWADQVSSLLTNFQVVSNFELSNENAGHASASHSLTGVRFEIDGQSQLVDTPEIINTLTQARGVDCAISGSQINIEEHAFNFPLGPLALVGFNKILEDKLGAANVGEALGMVLDCAAVADSVGPLCLGPVCLPVEDLCNDGVAAVANEIEKRIEAIEFAELRLAGGQAALEDAAKQDGFGQIDQLEGGTWQTDITVDSIVSIPVVASFTAIRQ